MTSIGVATRALRRIVLSAALTAGLTAPFTAHAEFEPGWYIGGGVGNYHVSEAESGLPSQLKGDNAVGQQIFAGYQLKYIAAEAGYIYLNTLAGTEGGIEVTDRLKGWFGRGLLMFPFEFSPTTSVAVFGGGSWHSWQEEFRIKDLATLASVKSSGSGDGTSITAGVWIRGRHAATRISYDLLSFKDNNNELSMWSISFIYHF